jgi:hypothetical protein
MICSSPVKGIGVYIAIREEMVLDKKIIIYKHADCIQVHKHIYSTTIMHQSICKQNENDLLALR